MQEPQYPNVPLIPDPSQDDNGQRQDQFSLQYPQCNQQQTSYPEQQLYNPQPTPFQPQQQQQQYPQQQQFPIQYPIIQQQTVIGQQVHFINVEEQINKLKSSMNPTEFYCLTCNSFQTTVIQNTPGAGTHLMALLLCCIGGLLICWIPYLVYSCQDVIHSCPNCRQEVGRRNFLNM